MQMVDQMFVLLIHEMHQEHQMLFALNLRENLTEISKKIGSKRGQHDWTNLSLFASFPNHVDLILHPF